MQSASVWLALSLLVLHQTLGKADRHEILAYRPGAITKVTIETIPQSKVFEDGEGCTKSNSRRMKKNKSQCVRDRCDFEPTFGKVYTRAEDLEEELARREDDEEMEDLEAEIEARERKEDEKERRMKTINQIQIRIK
ncbi:hypothetical protein TSMEX_009734 [Taenia solium]|eukprot:TsM_001173700 transcript=TsM_001173700 gene=TsM_001173700